MNRRGECRRTEPVDSQRGCHADALLQGGRGEGVAEDVRGDVLGEARTVGELLDQSLGSPRPDEELLPESEMVLQ